jgi:hypothetical protein
MIRYQGSSRKAGWGVTPTGLLRLVAEQGALAIPTRNLWSRYGQSPPPSPKIIKNN